MRLNQGNGIFGPETKYRASYSPVSLATADLNGDGFLDLVTAAFGEPSTAAIGILPGKGDGTFGTALTNFSGVGVALATQGLLLADLDGDGRPDLGSVRSASKAFTIRKNQTLPAIQIQSLGQSVKLTWL